MQLASNKVIFVNAVALVSGGGLITLKEFIKNIPPDNTYVYYIFSSIPSLEQEFPNKNIKYIFFNHKKNISRIYWDYIGMRNWSKTNSLRPDFIISLQNTPVNFYNNEIPQISYVMQCIPFIDRQWNFFNREERKMWFYKNIYPFFMKAYIGKLHMIVTQSEWVGKSFIKKFNISKDKVFPIRPILKDLHKYILLKSYFDTNYYNIFLPSAPHIYKNNEEIVNALIHLKNNNTDISKIKIHLTFYENEDNNLKNKINKNNLIDNFIFLGRLDYKVMLSYYKYCDLVVFPSYLETFGLPLLEAAAFGKPIICANEFYSQEVVSGYEGAILIDVDSPTLWANSIYNEYIQKRKFKNYEAKFNETWKDFFRIIDSNF